MSDLLVELRTQWETKQSETEAILRKEVPSDDELSKAEQLQKDMEEIGKQIDKYNADRRRADDLRNRLGDGRKAMGEVNRSLPFAGEHTDRKSRVDSGASEVDKLADTGGFNSLGHLAYAIFRKGRDGQSNNGAVLQLKRWQSIQPELAVKEAQECERLGFKAPSGSYEDSDPDGGDLVPREFSNQIYTRTLNQNQILSKLSPIQVVGNTLTVPALKEDSRVDGSRQGGLLAYWEGEADQYTKSKPTWRNVTARLKKLTVLSFVTEELLADSPTALDAWLGDRVPLEINFKVNDAVINGSGGGMPHGIMSSNSKITVAAVASQGANTIVAKNILAMFKRVVYSQRSSMVWLYNQDTEDALYSLFQPTGSTSGVLFFAPNVEGGNFRLMGKEAMCVEQCQTLGTEGDIIAFAPAGYFSIVKGGIQSFMSMHLRFDYDEFAYKWRFRFDGQPYDDVALTAYLGSTTYSSIVTLNSTRT